MIKIFHNPRCSKSREALRILEAQTENFEVIKYLETPLSEEMINELISLLKINPIDLVRKGEAIWKENYAHENLNHQQLIKAMVENPKLIERPIVINGQKAIIGRPPERITSIL